MEPAARRRAVTANQDARARCCGLSRSPGHPALRRAAGTPWIEGGAGAGLDPGYYPGYTRPMKTAISVPDPIFEEAEETAARLGMSRSQLYAKAVQIFVAQHRRDRVTEPLLAVYGSQGSCIDLLLAQPQVQSPPKDEW